MQFHVRLTKKINISTGSVVILRGIAYCIDGKSSIRTMGDINYVECTEENSSNFGNKYYKEDILKFDKLHIEMEGDRLEEIKIEPDGK